MLWHSYREKLFTCNVKLYLFNNSEIEAPDKKRTKITVIGCERHQDERASKQWWQLGHPQLRRVDPRSENSLQVDNPRALHHGLGGYYQGVTAKTQNVLHHRLAGVLGLLEHRGRGPEGHANASEELHRKWR